MKKYTIIFEWFFTEIRENLLQDLVGFAIIAGIVCGQGAPGRAFGIAILIFNKRNDSVVVKCCQVNARLQQHLLAPPLGNGIHLGNSVEPCLPL